MGEAGQNAGGISILTSTLMTETGVAQTTPSPPFNVDSLLKLSHFGFNSPNVYCPVIGDV